MAVIRPKTPQDVQTAVAAASAVVVHGAGTKPALVPPAAAPAAAASAAGAVTLDMRALNGLLAYEPDEYTFTAYAGTPVAAIAAALAEHGQYLPFDPLWPTQGATLGGTVAANSAGSGRLRYGGVRDFVLGVQFVDGFGRLARAGGKVVKNAAGFDLPKFFVGSLGRYGVLVALSFKVFPQPSAWATVTAAVPTVDAVVRTFLRLGTSPLELHALDATPAPGGGWTVWARLGGPAAALPGRCDRLAALLAADPAVESVGNVAVADEPALWADAAAQSWAPDGAALVKVPLTPRQLPALDAHLADLPRRAAVAGNVVWIATPQPAALADPLRALGLTGLQMTGTTAQPLLGARRGVALAQRIKRALDPHGKFAEA